MNTKKIAIINTICTTLKQVIIVALQFISRKVFLNSLGIELVGLNTTLTSIISATALAESGINSVIIFHLYRALQEKDNEDINSLMSIAKFYLRFVGILLICISCLISPFLKYFLTDIKVTFSTHIYFLLICASSAASYFLAYKRLLLNADRRVFVSDIIDSVCNVVFTSAKILFLIFYRSYLAYLIITIFQAILSNIFVQVVCQRLYPFLKKRKMDYERLRKMLKEIRELFMGTLASYLYASSDNIIISKFISTIYVGLVGNYTTITANIKSFVLNAVSIMLPIIGNKAAEKNSNKIELKNIFMFYDYMMFAVAVIIIIPEYILLQDFVSNFWGSTYVMSASVPCLLILDQYIVFVQDSNGIMLSTTGYFRELKVADGSAAIVNVFLSVILVNFLGVTGVLIGTVISRIIQWLIKAYYTHILYWDETATQFLIYWVKKSTYFMCTTCALIIANICYHYYSMFSFAVRFALGGFTGALIGLVTAVSAGALNGDLKRALRIITKKSVRLNSTEAQI